MSDIFAKAAPTTVYYAELIEKRSSWRYYGYVYRVVGDDKEKMAEIHSDSFWEARSKLKKALKSWRNHGTPQRKWIYR